MNPVAVMQNLNQLRERPELLVWSTLFAIGAALFLSGLQHAGRRPDLAERLARLDDNARFAHAQQGKGEPGSGFASTRVIGTTSSRHLVPRPVAQILRPFVEDAGWLAKVWLERIAPGLVDSRALERDLRLVGRGRSIRAFFAEKVIAALAFAVIPPALASVGGPVTPAAVWLVAGCVGFFVPNWDLARQVATRRTRIRMELPAVLDQLAIATSAGLSLEQAIADVARSSDGVVGDELRRAVVELEYGRWASIQEALGNLDRRNNVPELTLLSSQLQAAHAQGLPIMEVLAAQADSFRAQKKAALIDAGGKTTVKMVVPIAIFILPVLAIVILVPAVVQLMQIAE
jgi:Flp pilus assembly protein TadB